MKKLLLIMVAGSILMFCSSAWAALGITGSAHDFSGATWNVTTEICIVCHTPHNASAGNEPLWNHAVTAATFTVYASTTLDATPIGQPAATSKLCLSCHDGTVALDSYGGATGTNMLTGDAKVGPDLSNDHPISFTYDSTLATNDGGLFNPATELSGVSTAGTIGTDLLFAGEVQCASCHDVHNGGNLGIETTNLLRKSNTGSALCLTCHNK